MIGFNSLAALIDHRANDHGDRDAVVFPASRYSYNDLRERADRLAAALVALGVRRGDRVAYFMHECVDTLTTIFAVAKCGAVCVPLNARFKSHELVQVLEHSAPRVILATRATTAGRAATPVDHAQLLADVGPALRELADLEAIVVLGPVADEAAPIRDRDPRMIAETDALALGESVDRAELVRSQNAVQPDDTALILYTSGTTAMPKGAMLSHRAFLHFAASTVDDRMPIDGTDRVWTALPLFHVGGIAFALATVYAGAAFVHVGHFDADVALGQLRDERCTVALPGFETIWLPILNHPERGPDDLDALRIVETSGVPERLRQIQDATPNATVISCYGQTEACAFLSLSELDDPLATRVATGGFPLAGMEVEIRNPETAELLAPGNTGELWYRGPNMFDGYFRDPETNARVFDDRGFFRTGDVVDMDPEGRITFASRIKDMLKVGGENVAAAEVEGYLITHPAIEIAQVVAAPDAKYVEVPAAYVQLRRGHTVTEQDVIDYCRGRIATFRVPRYVRFVDDWPMSGTKVKKFVLRERIAAELESAGITEAPRVTSG